METAVTNATVLIFLARINRLDLLQVIHTIWITPEVQEEVLEGKNIPAQEKQALEQFIKKHTMIKKPTSKASLDLDRGEASALSLCLEKHILLFLSDDKNARKAAEILSIKPLGTLGILLKNLQKKRITPQEAKNIIEKLLEHSYYINTNTYARVIALIEQKKHS